jgi:prepilin-type N-terminal cleavage/methylation domain-containing protein
MISRTGRNRPVRCSTAAVRLVRRGGSPYPPRPGRSATGFTLIEIVLALALVVLLAGIGAMTMGAWGGNRTLEEGAGRIESALRMARAEAANQGRRIRLEFMEDGGRPQVQWEADPLLKPGVFEPMAACTWQDHLEMDRLRVERCQLVGPSVQRPADWGAELRQDAEEAPMAVLFEPDGSSDSAVIELSAVAAGDSRRAVITLDGRTGTITVIYVAPEEAGQP